MPYTRTSFVSRQSIDAIDELRTTEGPEDSYFF